MPGNQTVQRAILIGWMLFGWAVLILLAGLATLVLLGYFNHFTAPGPYHDLFATLFVMVAWPVVTWLLRFCVKHELWIFLVC